MQHTIVTQLFKDFLDALAALGEVDPVVIQRLSAALLERHEYRSDELRSALFAEEELP